MPNFLTFEAWPATHPEISSFLFYRLGRLGRLRLGDLAQLLVEALFAVVRL